MTQMHVHIERLVLDGLQLDAGGGEALRAALEGTLLEIATGGAALPNRSGDGNGASARMGNGEKASPGELGRNAAYAIHRHVGDRGD